MYILYKMKKLLALSGGGDRGAVLVGMLHGVYRALGKDAVKWDQIAGISAGAIVGALVSQTTPYDFDKRMEHARDLFESGGFHVVSPHVNLGYFANINVPFVKIATSFKNCIASAFASGEEQYSNSFWLI